MSEVVFLSNTNIQIAVGSSTSDGAKISKLISAPLPEGAVLNGVVMDKETVTEALKLVWHANKLPKTEVTLILNSPQLRANRVDAPLLADKKTNEFILREAANSDYGRFQKPATGWYVVSKDSKTKTQRVVYETAEIDFVNKYVEIFETAGLKLKSIHNGVQLAAEYFTKQSAGKTVLYMILDGKSLVTIFFSEGKFYYDSTSRVFAQPGTPEFAREIYSSISSIRQFISAQHLTETVKDVLFAGLTYSQVNQLANDILNIDSAVDISLSQPPSGTSIANDPSSFPFYVYPIAGIRKVDERIPILKATKQTQTKAEDKSGLRKLILPFAGIIVLLAIIYGGLLAFKASKEADLKEINSYNNNPNTIAQVKEYEDMYDNMAEMGKIQGGADRLKSYLDTYPVPDSTVNDSILSAAKSHNVAITINSYNALTGVFNITATAPDVDDINLFIADLMSMDIFEKVDYKGYELTSDGSSWQINVVCVLASRESSESSEAAEEVN